MLALGYQNYQSINALAWYSSKYCHILIILSVFFNIGKSVNFACLKAGLQGNDKARERKPRKIKTI